MNKPKNVVVVNKVSLPVLGLLGIAFVVLKLMGVISWSWWLVTLPFWIFPVIKITVFCFLWFCFLMGCVWVRYFGKEF